MASSLLGFEPAAASACRAYHEGMSGPSESERRQTLAAFARKVYENRLHIKPTPKESTTIDSLTDSETCVLEVAHDGQLPHLGVVRMVMKALDVAQLDGRAVVLYVVGNHYSAEMRPDNVHFGMPLRGSPPDTVKHPPKVRIGKANAHKPFCWLPPPSAEDLSKLKDQLSEFVGHNIAYERKTGRAVPEEVRHRITERLDEIFDLLTEGSRAVSSLGDWLVRVQHDLFGLLVGPEAGTIIVLPMMELSNLVGNELRQISRHSTRVSQIKAEVSAEQRAEGLDSYSRQPEVSSFWVYCPSCGRRQRTPWTPGITLGSKCGYCSHEQTLSDSDAWQFVMPDIVAYQSAVFHLGVDGWIAGSRASYHPVIQRVSSEVLGREAPPTYFLTSIPTFRGLGEPPEGYGKTRLLRALLELDPATIATRLRSPWDDNPRLASEFL